MKKFQIFSRIARLFSSTPLPSTPLSSAPLPSAVAMETNVITHHQTLQQIKPYTPKKSRWATFAAGKKTHKKKNNDIPAYEWFASPYSENHDSHISITTMTTITTTVADADAASATFDTIPEECIYDEKVEIVTPSVPTCPFTQKASAFKGYRTMPNHSSSRRLSPLLEVLEDATPRASIIEQEMKEYDHIPVAETIELGALVDRIANKTINFEDSAIFEEEDDLYASH